jgi:hypothetical protein
LLEPAGPMNTQQSSSLICGHNIQAGIVHLFLFMQFMTLFFFIEFLSCFSSVLLRLGLLESFILNKKFNLVLNFLEGKILSKSLLSEMKVKLGFGTIIYQFM